MRVPNLSKVPFLLLAGLLFAAPAAAIPVNFTVDGVTSSLSADLSATLSITAHTSAGNAPGSANASGALSSTPTGSISGDVSPAGGTNLMVDVPIGGAPISNPSPGNATGGATINLFGFIPFNFALDVNVDFIDINLASPLSNVATGPAGGPWTAADLVDIELSSQVDFHATGAFGIDIMNADIPIGPTVVPDVPLVATVEQLGGGAGSQITLPLPGLSISLPAQPATNVAAPGCEVSNPIFGGCLFNVYDVDVQLTSLTLSNIQGMIVATSSTVVPEPSVTLLLGSAALAGLAFAGRRRD